ncbi:MAG: ankyrin repeat domain-containing protein [Bifidobacteriaceae bacterium]|jgi:hypothetical protein|nr:ankyrin repeat domain-containing protein [Bifidobacteriaceae bacterium]
MSLLFQMVVEDVFSVSGRGTVATGAVALGAVRVGDEVMIHRRDGGILRSAVTGIESFKRLADQAGVGDHVGLLLRGIARDDISAGDSVQIGRGAPAGAPGQEAPRFCRHCGAKLRENARFCSACGKPVDSAAAAPAPAAPAPAPAPTKTADHYYQLARRLSGYLSLSGDEGPAEAMEAELLAGGVVARDAVLGYLARCAAGRGDVQWWNSARRLVKLIGRHGIVTPKSDQQALRELIDRPSNIWEYETQVKYVAREILEADKPRNEPAPSVPSEMRVDRKMTAEQKKTVMAQAELAVSKCSAYGNEISVRAEGVVLSQWWYIPFSDIRETVLLPVLETGPAMGGALKFVTDDNPDLPIRDSHSFHMPGERDRAGVEIGRGNCHWFNCCFVRECRDVNAEMAEIKALVDSHLRAPATAGAGAEAEREPAARPPAEPEPSVADPAQLGKDLVSAAERERWAEANRLIEHGADVNARGTSGITALIWAAYHGDAATARALIDAGADVNQFGADESPLMAAARKNHLDVVELLLDRGADVDATDFYGSSAVRLAQRKGLTRMVAYLKSRGGRYLGA